MQSCKGFIKRSIRCAYPRRVVWKFPCRKKKGQSWPMAQTEWSAFDSVPGQRGTVSSCHFEVWGKREVRLGHQSNGRVRRRGCLLTLWRMVEILPVEKTGGFPATGLEVDKDTSKMKEGWNVKFTEEPLGCWSCRGRCGPELRSLESLLCVY